MRGRILMMLLLLLAVADAARAEGFAGRFRDFIIGTEAQAHSSAPTFDSATAACVSCHQRHENHLTGMGRPARNHPVGINYDSIARLQPHSYRPAAQLPADIRLVNGQVSCVSCHRPKDESVAPLAANASAPCTASKELTRGPRDRELCLACHIK